MHSVRQRQSTRYAHQTERVEDQQDILRQITFVDRLGSGSDLGTFLLGLLSVINKPKRLSIVAIVKGIMELVPVRKDVLPKEDRQ